MIFRKVGTMNQKRIKELEARQTALQEEMEPKRNACLEASQKFNAIMEDYQSLSSKISFLTEEQSKVREEVNHMSDKASDNGFYTASRNATGIEWCSQSHERKLQG